MDRTIAKLRLFPEHGSMSVESQKPVLSHLDAAGQACMVDVSGKASTVREAVASAMLEISPAVLAALLADGLKKKDALATARVAGIAAAKRTSEWIPLCHPLPLDWVGVVFSTPDGGGQLRIECTARTTARTGVEMEALTGVSAAALTIYDMAKAGDKGIRIGPIQLETKTGGQSGTYTRAAGIAKK